MVGMSDPHSDDYCVVCKKGPEKHITMHPVKDIDNGYVCQACIDNATKHFTGRP